MRASRLVVLIVMGGLGCADSKEANPDSGGPAVDAAVQAVVVDASVGDSPAADATTEVAEVDSASVPPQPPDAAAPDLIAAAAQPDSGGDVLASEAGGAGAIVTCLSELAAIANPGDFSPNPETGAMDPHTLIMRSGDVIRGTNVYRTHSAGDHEHEIEFTFEQRKLLLAGESFTVITRGPPLNAATGHQHTVLVRSCGKKP